MRRGGGRRRCAGPDALDRVCVGSFSLLALLAVRAREPRMVTGAARKEGQRALYRSWLGLSPGRVPYRAFQVPEQAGRLTRRHAAVHPCRAQARHLAL